MAAQTELFKPALDALAVSGQPVYEAGPFRDYIAAHNLKAAGKTPEHISLDHWGRLPAYMKEANVMVLRLGAAGGGVTRFALVQVADVRDFFLFDDEDMAVESAGTFLSPASLRSLFGFSVVQPSETTLVNLAFASGLMSAALNLDDVEPLAAPATGSSVANFKFRPHSAYESQLEHLGGQVQVDGVFVGRRGGKDVLFVLEAKQTAAPLAKHKLVYPVMGLIDYVPADIEVVPVYLRASRSSGGFEFAVGECYLPDLRVGPVALDELKLLNGTKRFRLPLAWR